MQQVGQYEIQNELGRGAVGSVFAARDSTSGRQVAIKLLNQTTPDRVKRFLREAQVTAALDHPGIVRVHAYDVESGHPYVVLELVEGARPLDEVFSERNPSQRVALVRDAALALGHAHGQGIVHRDVKPANVLVDAMGRVRVTDFGLAWTRDLERLTRTGTLMGTPSYMAPEQIGGERARIGPATDVWALGVVLYLALTNELPFAGDSFAELAVRIASAHPARPSSLAPDVSRSLEAVCLKALASAPEDRYRNGTAMAEDLDLFLSGSQVSAVVGRRRAPTRWGILIPLGIGAVALVGAWFAPTQQGPQLKAAPSPRGLPAAPPNLDRPRELSRTPWRLETTLTLSTAKLQPGELGRAVFTPTGRLLTFGTFVGVCLWELGTQPRLLRAWPKLFADKLLLGPSGEEFFVSSYTLQTISSARLDQPGTQVHRVEVDGEPVAIAGLDVSPRGPEALFVVGGGRSIEEPEGAGPLLLVTLPAGQARARIERRLPDQPGGVQFARFTRDGRSIMIVTKPPGRTRRVAPGPPTCYARMFRVADGASERSQQLPSRAFALEAHPTQRSFAVSLRSSIGIRYRVGRLWLVAAEPGSALRRFRGDVPVQEIPKTLLAAVGPQFEAKRPFAHHHEPMGVAFTPDGRWVITASGQRPPNDRPTTPAELRIWEVERPDAEYREMYPLELGVVPSSVAVSPDGRRVAVGTRSGTVLIFRLE